MDKFITFVSDNYIWFLLITIFLIFALIGYIYDNKRSKYLEDMGYKVIRFINTDVDYRFDSVCESIMCVIKEKRKYIAKV